MAGNVNLNTSPQGATVCIDGTPILDTTGNRVVTPVIVTDISAGSHKFVFRSPLYYLRQEITADVVEGTTTDISVVLTPVPWPKGC